MSYCINPGCPNFNDPDNASKYICANCGPERLLQERYRVIQPLARGSFGQTFEVDDLQSTTNEQSKRKVLKVLLTNYPQAVSLFQREARILTLLNHPGIPKVEPDGYFTLCPEDSKEQLHCLVMEKIEGINLKDWLKIQHNQLLQPEQAIAWLKQLAEILIQIHGQQYLHRDIKPSNIMLKPNGRLVLIDFGAVREATGTYLQKLEGKGGTVIIAPGYTPPEQANGKAVPKSDFYALGRTFVHLLTGKHPLDFSEDNQGELMWRSSAPQVPPQLADLVDYLMSPLSVNRPESAQEILHSLNEIERYPSRKWFTGGLVVSAILLSITTAINQVITQPTKTCTPQLALSCGEKILFPNSAVPEKQKAAQAFANQDYQSAIRWLELARLQERHDPETLIYLNNAKIAEQPTYTIAVVGSTGCNKSAAQEVLQGVAQAQHEVNYGAKINGKGLRVIIADDGNVPTQGKQIAETLGTQAGILGVIGHCASEVSLAAADVYKQHQLVMISPTSTSEELSLKGQSNPFIFRTVPSDRVAAMAMASYLVNQARRNQAAIFYNPQSSFSKSLRDQFRISFSSSRGKVVAEFDLSAPAFDATTAINSIQKDTALILLPDAHTHPRSFGNALDIVKVNQRRYLLVGGDSFYSAQVLQTVGQEAEERLIVAIPWHSLNSPQPKFSQAAKNLWGSADSWRTASAYDATRVLIKALAAHPQPSRQLIQQTLKDPQFQVSGAMGVIRFQANGDQIEPINQLVKVVKSSCSNSIYRFLPLEISAAEMQTLKCVAKSLNSYRVTTTNDTPL